MSSRLMPFLEGLGSVVGCQPPSATIYLKMFPAFNRGVTGAQRVLEGVFVALCPRLPPLPGSAASQSRAEDLFWKTALLHSHHVAAYLSLAFVIETSAPGMLE